MAAASRGAARRPAGPSSASCPAPTARAANQWVTIALPTGLGELRNGLIVRAADAVVAVGGAYGTLSEVALALAAGVPVVGLSNVGDRRGASRGQPRPRRSSCARSSWPPAAADGRRRADRGPRLDDVPTFKPAYLIHGDDHGRIAERRARLRALAESISGAEGLELLEGDAATPDAVAAALDAMTLALGRRFIIVDGVERWKDKELDALEAALGAHRPRDDGRLLRPRGGPHQGARAPARRGPQGRAATSAPRTASSRGSCPSG